MLVAGGMLLLQRWREGKRHDGDDTGGGAETESLAESGTVGVDEPLEVDLPS